MKKMILAIFTIGILASALTPSAQAGVFIGFGFGGRHFHRGYYGYYRPYPYYYGPAYYPAPAYYAPPPPVYYGPPPCGY
jgi:hypothetical protein